MGVPSLSWCCDRHAGAGVSAEERHLPQINVEGGVLNGYLDGVVLDAGSLKGAHARYELAVPVRDSDHDAALHNNRRAVSGEGEVGD